MKDIKEILSYTGPRIKKLIHFNKDNEAALKRQFLRIADTMIGKDYIVTEQNRYIITDLLKYFTGNAGEYDLNKGIYIYGYYGLGKTILMAAIRKLLATYFPFNPNGFLSVSLEKIIENYKEAGNVSKYGYGINDNPINLCIDEFGKEMNEKIYGTKADNVIHSLLMMRYELFQAGKLTHVTSNYSPEDINIEPIIKDRMAEMFNFIEINGDSFRK